MKSIRHLSSTLVACGCGSEVIICVDESLVSSGAPFVFGVISSLSQTLVSCSTTYVYSLIYDEGQLVTPSEALTESQVNGILCKGCLTDYIDYVLSQNVGWGLRGNAGTDTSTNFLGTTDATGVNLRVNNVVGFRVEPDLVSSGLPYTPTPTPIIVGGSINNQSNGSPGSAILSGGWELGNTILANTHKYPDFITYVLGDQRNSVICSGENNDLIGCSHNSFMGSGYFNSLEDGNNAAIVGGSYNAMEPVVLQTLPTLTIYKMNHHSVIVGGEAGWMQGGTHSLIVGGYGNSLRVTEYCSVLSGNGNKVGNSSGTSSTSTSSIVSGYYNRIDRAHLSLIGNGAYNTISTASYADIFYTVNVGNTIVGGCGNTLSTTSCSTILGGMGLKLGSISVGFQAQPGMDSYFGSLVGVDVSSFTQIGYFGDIDIWIGNVSNSARKLKFFEPNSSLTYSGTNYSSFEAQSQSANIEYKLPATAGVAGNTLKIQGVVGNVVTLEWA